MDFSLNFWQRYLFEKGRIIDSIQVFEFNFRDLEVHTVLVSRIRNSIVYILGR